MQFRWRECLEHRAFAMQPPGHGRPENSGQTAMARAASRLACAVSRRQTAASGSSDQRQKLPAATAALGQIIDDTLSANCASYAGSWPLIHHAQGRGMRVVAMVCRHSLKAQYFCCHIDVSPPSSSDRCAPSMPAARSAQLVSTFALSLHEPLSGWSR